MNYTAILNIVDVDNNTRNTTSTPLIGNVCDICYFLYNIFLYDDDDDEFVSM